MYLFGNELEWEKEMCWAFFPQCIWVGKMIYNVTRQGVPEAVLRGLLYNKLNNREYQAKIYNGHQNTVSFIQQDEAVSLFTVQLWLTINTPHYQLSVCGSNFTEAKYEDRGNTFTVSLLHSWHNMWYVEIK